MPKVILYKGLSASGKTTQAKQKVFCHPGQFIRVNKDDIREMLHNGKYSKGNERVTIQVRNSIIADGLRAGKNVIVDDTNLNPVHEEDIRKLIKSLDVKASLIVDDSFLDVPVEQCIRRDSHRSKPVGADVIRHQYNRWVKPNLPVEEQSVASFDPRLPCCYICDLDGTIANLNGRNPYDAETCDQDIPNEPVISVVSSLSKTVSWVIFVSGRKGTLSTVEKTDAWIRKHVPLYSHKLLYMRKEDDQRNDAIIKKEIYDNNIRGNYNVLGVFDDRQRVVDMWRSLGLTVFQVAEGNF